MITEKGKKIKLLTDAKAQQSKGFRCKLEGWCDSGSGTKTHSALSGRVKAGRKFSYRREIKGRNIRQIVIYVHIWPSHCLQTVDTQNTEHTTWA